MESGMGHRSSKHNRRSPPRKAQEEPIGPKKFLTLILAPQDNKEYRAKCLQDSYKREEDEWLELPVMSEIGEVSQALASVSSIVAVYVDYGIDSVMRAIMKSTSSDKVQLRSLAQL